MSIDPFSTELAAEHRGNLLQRAAEYRMGRGVSHARRPVPLSGFTVFFRRPDNPPSADITLDVVDEWRSRGVGSMLAARLAARSRCEGITRFTALMSADNLCVKRLLTKMGDVTPVARHGADRSYLVALAAPAPIATRRHATPLAPAGCAR